MQLVPVLTPTVPRPLSYVERMKIELDCLKKNLHEIESGTPPSTVAESLLSSINVIDDIVQLANHANDFQQMGGFNILPKLLSLDCTEIRANTAELIAHLAQNDKFCQGKLMETNIGEVVMNLLKVDTDTSVCVKALYALSCLCRNNDKVVEIFKELDAIPVLLEMISKPDDKVKIKAAFFLSCVVKEPKISEMLNQAGLVSKLIVLMKTEESACQEYVLSILLTLAENDEKSKQQCCADSSLKPLLEEKLLFYQEKDEYLESYNYVFSLLKLCYGNGT